jgi:hypothetical protein
MRSRRSARRAAARRLFMEKLEGRELMAADMNADVDGDGLVAPRDALLVINALNRHGEFASDSSLDVNRDRRVTSSIPRRLSQC